MGNNQVLCKPINTFLNVLKEKGFVMVNNGNYEQEKNTMPNPDSLYFRLRSPLNLGEIDLTEETYYLVTFRGNLYMCECHFNLVKLLPPDYSVVF